MPREGDAGSVDTEQLLSLAPGKPSQRLLTRLSVLRASYGKRLCLRRVGGC